LSSNFYTHISASKICRMVIKAKPMSWRRLEALERLSAIRQGSGFYGLQLLVQYGGPISPVHIRSSSVKFN
jgi:hypothetical protein